MVGKQGTVFLDNKSGAVKRRVNYNLPLKVLIDSHFGSQTKNKFTLALQIIENLEKLRLWFWGIGEVGMVKDFHVALHVIFRYGIGWR